MDGLVLFDYDGTLVDERDHINTPTNKTREAVEQLQKSGYLCVLATGRAQSYIPKGARDLFLDGYITSNGACVSIYGKVIYQDVFEDDELIALLHEFDNFGINFILESKSLCYVKDLEEKNYKHFIKNFAIPEDNFVAYQTLDQVRGHIEKITLAFVNQEELQVYAKIIEKNYCVSYHRNCNTFDLAKRNMNKGVGVQKVMQHFNISKKNTYAFGDGSNDVELLDSVEHGIAMRIHDKVLDPIATMVTGSVKEEGIYYALKKMEVI